MSHKYIWFSLKRTLSLVVCSHILRGSFSLYGLPLLSLFLSPQSPSLWPEKYDTWVGLGPAQVLCLSRVEVGRAIFPRVIRDCILSEKGGNEKEAKKFPYKMLPKVKLLMEGYSKFYSSSYTRKTPFQEHVAIYGAPIHVRNLKMNKH